MTTGLLGQREADRAAITELLDAVRGAAMAMTETAGLLASQIQNSVLEVKTRAFDANGLISRRGQFKVAVGSVTVTNLSPTHEVTISATDTTTDNAAPTEGVGVYRIPAGQTVTVGLASRTFTLYGTPGEYVSWQAWTAGARPVA